MKCKYILGVDGGGTRTTANIADLEGKILTEHIVDSSNYKSVGKGIAEENINNAVFGAMGKLDKRGRVGIESSCFGIAGNGTEYDLEIYKKIIYNKSLKVFLDPSRTMICNDSRIGLEAGSTMKNRIKILIWFWSAVCLNAKNISSRSFLIILKKDLKGSFLRN